jgi:hypothetical protein
VLSLLGLSCVWLASLSACSAPDSAAVGSVEPPSARCAACHLQEFQATTHPPHPGVRPTTCAVCHSETDWHPARKVLVHSFPLDGAHAKTACFNCHGGPTPVFEGTSKPCANCHQKEHDSANAKVERHSSFPDECQTCHTTTAWKPTLPHDEPPSTVDATEPPSAPAASSALSNATKPALKPPKAPSTTPPPISNNKTPKPDQVSGASRSKKR